uniref:Putative ubiquitin regulatory protein n=1 Tax=Panstrongylus megistus TaxID=65343 RepID=A0A069DSU0_9HEMI
MSSPFATILMDMGFPKEKVEQALNVTGNQGVEPAMEWLLAHGDSLEGGNIGQSLGQKLDEEGTPAPSTSNLTEEDAAGTSGLNDEDAKSIKCEDCNKLFRTQLEVEYHAAKTGHANFSQSTEEKKPLTEEEKKAQLQLLEEKIKQKKIEKEALEKAEELEREKNRIKSGKEIVAIRKKFQEEEFKKAIEERKREKEEDRLARQKIKEQIEADKLARKVKAGGVIAETITTPPPTVVKPPPPKEYNEARLQIRLTNGTTLTQSFGAKEQLSAVRLYIEMNRTDDNGPFTLMTSFPRKIFSDEDYEKPLEVLGLVPSAVIIVSRALN